MGKPTKRDWRALHEAAKEARRNAHAPYSEYHVGAALRAEDGRVFVGANVENASLGLSVCAERNAIGAAIAAGARRFDALVIVTEGARAAAPCGVCRQVLAEFPPSFPVRCYPGVEPKGGAKPLEVSVSELLPHAFDATYLDQEG